MHPGIYRRIVLPSNSFRTIWVCGIFRRISCSDVVMMMVSIVFRPSPGALFTLFGSLTMDGDILFSGNTAGDGLGEDRTLLGREVSEVSENSPLIQRTIKYSHYVLPRT